MKKIVIAGGNGFLGKSFIHYLSKDHNPEIIVLTRSEIESDGNVQFVKWDGEALGSWVNHLNNADVLINLSGRTVNCRYTKKNQKEIYDSRIKSTYILGEAIKKCDNPPHTWINMSTATIYRDEYEGPNDEHTGKIGSGFSVDVAKKWERTFFAIPLQKTRKIAIRTAIALGKDGDVFKIYRNHVRMFLAGKHGKGNQMVSWIHEEDIFRALMFLIAHEDCEGIYNLAAPHPLIDREFMKIFRNTAGYRWGLPIPAWMLNIGAMIIRTEPELILKSRWVIPGKLGKQGFKFKFAHLEDALAELMSRSKRKEVKVKHRDILKLSRTDFG